MPIPHVPLITRRNLLPSTRYFSSPRIGSTRYSDIPMLENTDSLNDIEKINTYIDAIGWTVFV
jgi:hypothetical protein